MSEVQCEYCGKWYKAAGIKRHQTVKHADERDRRDDLGGVGKDTPDPATFETPTGSVTYHLVEDEPHPIIHEEPLDSPVSDDNDTSGVDAPPDDRSRLDRNAAGRPRIAALVHFAAPTRLAGAETMLARLMDDLAHSLNADCRIFTTAMPNNLGEWEYGAHTVASYDGQNPAVDAMRDWSPDLVITHLDNTERGVDFGRREQIPSVIICHNEMFHTRQLVRKLKKHVGLFVFNGEWAERRTVKGQPDVASIIVHPPIPNADPMFETTGDRITLVNLNIDKGAGTFYALAAHMPHYKFLGVTGSHGRQLIRDDRYDNVEVLPQIRNMPVDVWSRTRVLLMPSVYESFGMVALEAASHGIPTIAHPAGGLRQALGDGGIWLNRSATRRWALKLEELFTDQDAYHAASMAALNRATEMRGINAEQRTLFTDRIGALLADG